MTIENNNNSNPLDDILGADDDAIAPSQPRYGQGDDDRVPEWVKAEDILYQPIIVTRANVTDIEDKFAEEPGKMKTVAFVNFFYADDEAETPFVFKTGWQAIRNAVESLNRAHRPGAGVRMYPFACGVTEMLNRQPIAGHFPLRFSPSDQLEALEDQARQASMLQTAPSSKPLYGQRQPFPATAPETTGDTTPPVVAPTAPAASPTQARSTAAKATGGSANTTNSVTRPARPTRNLTTRGN